MRTYIAKGPHKRGCDLCGDAILPGDLVATWCWVNEDGPGEPGGFGNVMRVHETCEEINEACGFHERWNLGSAFEEWDDEGEVPHLVPKAKAALAAARGKTEVVR